MSIFRRVSFLCFALVPVVILAACGGNGGDGDGSGKAFELPPPGEYRFEVTGTMEIEFLEEAVNAAPLALQGSETVQVEGSITIQWGNDGKFTIKDKEGVDLVTGDLEGGPIRFTQNEDKPSTGTISEDGVKIELNVEAELPNTDGPVTTTSEEPIRLESDDDPFSDEGATLRPSDTDPVKYTNPPTYHVILEVYIGQLKFGWQMGWGDGFGMPASPTPSPVPDAEEPPPDDDALLEFTDPPDDATDCATGAAVDDPAVDIEEVNVRKVGEKIEVEVRPVQSPTISFEEAYSMAVIVLLFGWEGLLEIHAGERRQGQTDSSGNVIPGTEGDVTVTDDAVTFAIPNGESIPKGSLLEVKAFHMGEEGDAVNCDTFMTEYTCFGRCDD